MKIFNNNNNEDKMITKTQKIAKDLEKALAPTDIKYIDRMVEYYESRHKAMRDYQEQNRRTTIADDYMYYRELHAVSGGKTLYNQLSYEPAPYYASQDKNSPEYDPSKPLFGYDENGRNDSVKNLAIKNAKKTLKARNNRLAIKLRKEEVTEIIDSEVKYTTDGFHGTYKVNTNNGAKTIKLETIIAGGYNIQVAHYRTLINFIKELA